MVRDFCSNGNAHFGHIILIKYILLDKIKYSLNCIAWKGMGRSNLYNLILYFCIVVIIQFLSDQVFMFQDFLTLCSFMSGALPD